MSARETNENRQKACRWGEGMYRGTMFGQQKLEIPFGVELDANNRWIQLASLMPWEYIEELYAQNFDGTSGQEAKTGRLAFAALYIQNRLDITDRETVDQIRENPPMQYFCGFESYTTGIPFDSSLMVHFRKRISAEMMKAITEKAFAAEALSAIEKEEDDDDDDKKDGEPKPKGTLLLDSTCCPSDIHFPTDVGLLNHARELTEGIIDNLHEQLVKLGVIKPRTYREIARRAYLAYVRSRKHTYAQIRFAIRQQLQYVRRNLDSIAKQVEFGANLGLLGKDLYRKLLIISELYRQQKQMYDEKTHKVEDRIVSISQPHIRPIVRGKAGTPVEFGAKVATAHIGGFSFVIHLGYDNFSEAQYLKKSAEEYKRIFGFYPKVIIGDKAYAINDNRNYCKSKGIRLSAPKRGRKSEEVKEAERKQLYQDSCRRNAIEGDYGTGKRKYGLDLIMTKLYETTLTAISFGFFVKNMERLLRLLVLLIFSRMVYYDDRNRRHLLVHG
jgi:IS5 family transposase